MQAAGFATQQVASLQNILSMTLPRGIRKWKFCISQSRIIRMKPGSCNMEGEVLLEVVFGANGALHVNRVVRGLGHGLDEAAVTAALTKSNLSQRNATDRRSTLTPSCM